MYQCPIRCSVLCEDRAAKRLFASSFAIDGPDLVKVSFVAAKAKVIPSHSLGLPATEVLQHCSQSDVSGGAALLHPYHQRTDLQN